MGSLRAQRPWYRRYAGWLAAVGLAVAAVAVFAAWPRGPVYADYVEGGRPTVVFIWSDPTPHHPHG